MELNFFLKLQERNLDCSAQLWARMLLLFKSQGDTKLVKKDIGKDIENIFLCFYYINLYSHQQY